MQTTTDILTMYAKNLELRGILQHTQQFYLRVAREFLEWLNRSGEEMKEDDINAYLLHLEKSKNLKSSTLTVRKAVLRLLFGSITGKPEFCPSSRVQPLRNGYLKDDKKSFIRYLADMQYAEKNLDNYKWTLNRLERFMQEQKQLNFSHEIGEKFLSEMKKNHTSSVMTMMRYVIRRFACFKESGEWVYKMLSADRQIPPQFDEELLKYLESLQKKGLRTSTIENHRYNLRKALLILNETGIKHFSEITPEVIYAAFEKSADKQSFASTVRSLLKYLFDIKILRFDYSVIVPSVRKSRPVPSVYTKTETEKLLNTCNTESFSDKRDIAIILLALRLGIRSGDIRNLRFSDIDRDNKEISFVQQKTGIPQRLALVPEVEIALSEYISSARPESDSPNIFLSTRAPYQVIAKQSIYSIVSRRFEKSGVETGERKSGGHALRSTLASELVAEKVHYDAVRRILGHEDPVVIKHYVKLDIEELRSCAIETPPLTGQLASYMNARTGGRQ